MEVSLVRKHLLAAIERSKAHQQQRRLRTAEAEVSYRRFLDGAAIPVARQLGQALKAAGYPFTVFTPTGAVRLASDHGRDDYIEVALDTTADPPQVVGRVSRVRGSRTLTTERVIKDGAAPADISDEEVLAYFVDALEPWLER